MKLRDRSFERRFKRRVRQEIAASPALRRETRRVRAPTQFKIPPTVARLVLTAFLAWAAYVLALAEATERALSAFAIVVALMETFWLAGSLPATLYDPAQLAVLTPLPIADSTIFRRQWGAFVRSGLGSLLDLVTIHLVIGLHAGMPPGYLALAGVIGALQGVGAFSMGVWISLSRRHSVFQGVGCLGIVAFVAVGIWGQMLLPVVVRVLDFAAPVLFCVPPIGWFEAAWHFGVQQGSVTGLALLLPAIVLATLGRLAYQRAKSNYSLGESVREPTESGMQEEEIPEAAQPATGDAEHWPEVTPEQIKLGLAEQPDWSGLGLIERFALRWLTPRERRVAWFLTSDLPNWSKSWKRSMTLTLIAIGGSLLPDPLGSWALTILAGLAFAIGLPMLGGFWPGFTGMPIYGAQVPCLAFFPVGFREISRTVFKANAVRCAAFLPQALLLGAASRTLLQVGLSFDLFLGLKLLLAVTSVQPIAIVFKLSQVTNDTSHVTWSRLVRVLALVFLILLFLVLSIVMLVVTELPPVLGLIAAMFATSLAAWAYYARCYDRSRFDLLRASQQ